MPSIKYKKKTYAGATFPVLEMTKAEYDALSEAKKMDGTVYMITDDTGGWEAENSAYDNTQSGLTATNVQDALDELDSNQTRVESYLMDFKNIGGVYIYRIGRIAFMQMEKTVLYSLASGTKVIDLPDAVKPNTTFRATIRSSSGSSYGLAFNTSGSVLVDSAIPAGTLVGMDIVWLTA